MKYFNKYSLACIAAIATLFLYLPALRNDFVDWDDGVYIIDNPFIRSIDSGFFKWAFFDFYASNWHPIAWISHAIDYALWGLNPIGHHLTSIVLHAINTALVVLLAARLLEASNKLRDGRSGLLNARKVLIPAFAMGILFGIHPLHVESVVWTSERKDLLCAAFFLLSIMTYIKYVSVPDAEAAIAKRLANKYYLFTLGSFLFALLSKPMAVTLPVVLTLLDWHPFARMGSWKRFWMVCVEKIPFVILSSLASIVAVLAQRSASSVIPLEIAPVSTRIVVAFGSIVSYLWKMVWPQYLVPYYPYPEKVSPLSVGYLLPVAIVIAVTMLATIYAHKQKTLFVAWSYYIVTLIPVLGLIQVGHVSMADRFTYLPTLGPFFVLGIAVSWVWEKVQMAERHISVVRGSIITLAVSITVTFCFLTYEQIGIWKDSLNLWSYVIQKEPETPFAYNGRGAAYIRLGLYDRALTDLNSAIVLRPFYADAYFNRGAAYGNMGQYDKAIDDFNTVLALNPSYYQAYRSRGLAFDKLGKHDLAIENYNKAEQFSPQP